MSENNFSEFTENWEGIGKTNYYIVHIVVVFIDTI